MPKDYTSTTFSEVYKDDYADSDGYYRVLFNSGRPLQARELTQLQTILQTQIQRFASNIFLDGAAVSASGAGVQKAEYVVLETFASGNSASNYVGQILQGPAGTDTSGLQFHVLHAEDASDDGDFPTLYGVYRSANQSSVNLDDQTSTPTFDEGDELTDIRVLSGQSGASNVVVRTQPGSSQIASTGNGLLFGIKSANFWTQGHFVFAPEQLLVISKYNTTADVDVGFEVKQDIITVDDTDTLYDNQGSVPNLSSPGADRYRIRLDLTARSEVADPYKFVFLASVREGRVTQIKGGSESYNQVEKRMAVRHHETHGDFIANPWNIRFTPADSSSRLNVIVDGNVNGLNPTAFVDGYRLVNYNDEVITIDKPTSTTTEENTSANVAYKNYVNAPFSEFDNWIASGATPYNLNLQTKMALVDSSNVVLGNARVKHIVNTLDDSEGYQIHLYDVKMKNAQNFRQVKRLKPHDDAGTGVALTLDAGNLYATGPEINTSLHEIPGGRVSGLTDISYVVQRQYTSTSSGGSIVQISTGLGETFVETAQWVFVNTSTGAEETVGPSQISTTAGNPDTATISVSSASANYTVYAYVRKTSATAKTKTYSRHASTGHITASRATDSAGERFQFNLYDGISLVEARADSAGGRIITDQVTFDGGQRDNYYGPVVLKSDGLPASVSDIHARFEFFTWGAGGDHFSVNSYALNDSFQYADIPIFTSPRDGEKYDLRNQFDFRPKLDPLADTMGSTDRFEVLKDGDNISYTVDLYNRRIDHVVVGYNPEDFTAQIRVNSGTEALQPQPPEKKISELVLYTVEYGGNTLNVKDLSAFRHRHKRFRMTDIAKLEDRVNTLEETVSLSFLEQEAVNLVELNSSGEVRSKTGFFVDDFKGGFNLTSSIFEPNWIEDDNLIGQTLVAVDENKFSIEPKRSIDAVQMLYDSDNSFGGRTGITQSDVVRKGDIVYLDYAEVLDSSLVNEVISWYSDGRSYEEQGWYNVNPFNVFSGEGFLKLSPASDVWTDNYHLPDQTVIDEEETIQKTIYPSGGSGQLRVRTTTKVEDVVTDITEDVIAFAVPFARQREVFGKVQGLRPNTRYWPFFDRVNVEQWTISETETEYKTHLAKNDHLRGYPEVDVTILQHPRRSAEADSILISDYKGDLFFSFWLPNNAPVPSPNANEMNTFEEWEQWVDAQRKEAAKYPTGIDDPRVYDDIGWKFRSGSVNFLLNDVSTNVIENGLSNAQSLYTSSGSINVTQNTIHMTRVTTNTTQYYYGDPLGQSFMIDGRNGVEGSFVTKVDVFMRRAPKTTTNGGTDLAIPLELQIRAVENGVPLPYPAGEQYRVFMPADDIYSVVNNINDLEDIDDVLSNPVTFEFPEPVFLKANEEYAIVLKSECDDYEAFISTTYGLILGKTEERVNKQPATGSLFLSQNGSTWTPRQDQNLAYRIYTAKFKRQGTFNFFNGKYTRHRHNTSIMSVDSNDMTRFRVNQIGHGLGVGDLVKVTGLDSASSYLGVTGSDIMSPTLVVDSADVAGYYVPLASGSFAEAGWFGADSATSNQGFNFDRGMFSLMTQEYPQTSIEYLGNFSTGVSHSKIDLTATADPRFDTTGRNIPFRANREILFNGPKYLGNPDQEFSEIAPSGDSAPSIVVGTTMKTSSTSTFGGPRAANQASNGYVSDVSPIVDLQRSMFLMENFIVDNQPVDSSSSSELTNSPAEYLPETHPTLGSSPSKHLTKPVVLDQSANGIRVFVDMYRPPAATVEVYYRTVSDPDEDIYTAPFVKIESENEPPANVYSPETFDVTKIKYNEYKYLIGGLDGDLPDFTKFQIKLVMKTTNTVEIPIVKSIRAIALI